MRRRIRAGDVAHRVYARPARDRQRRRRHAAAGRRVQATPWCARRPRARVARSLRRVRRRLPDAEARVRRARRIRRGLLRVARRRRSLVPRAAARLSLPLCCRRGRSTSWQRDDRAGSADSPSFTGSATSNGCTSRTRRRRCCCTTLPGHVIYNAAAAVHFARAGLLGPFMRAKLAALAGMPKALRKRREIQRTRRVEAAAPSTAARDAVAFDEAA